MNKHTNITKDNVQKQGYCINNQIKRKHEKTK